MKKYYIDIDGTICETTGLSYRDSVPIRENIEKANKLYEEGNIIVYWTGRGRETGIDWMKETRMQLESWGVKFHDLMQKPYDVVIDNDSVDPDNWK